MLTPGKLVDGSVTRAASKDAPTIGGRAKSRHTFRPCCTDTFQGKLNLGKIGSVFMTDASAMPDHDLSQYLAYLLASAHRQMRIGIAQSIADEEVNEEHWRIMEVVADEQGHSM